MTRKLAPAADADSLDPAILFARLAGRRGLILAVSGGPDSTALMLLMARWSERPPTVVVTVDHRLRPEAADEARVVEKNAALLGLPCRIMRPAEPRTVGNLQDWARRARYACLIAAAREAEVDTIVTAHHQDDQAETFLLRLARGSGIYGLAAMREEEPLDGVALARPLLGVARDALQEIASASGLETVTDPSNADLRFDRVRMRALMPTLAEHGLDAPLMADTAGRLRRAAKALDHYAGELLQTHFRADSFGAVAGPAAALASVPEEVALRSLARILRAVGGSDYTPRLLAVESLYAAIVAATADKTLKRTLSGVVVEVARGGMTAHREWGRAGLPEVSAAPGTTVLWDGRFSVRVPDLAGKLTVGALGRSEGRLRSPLGGQDLLRTLPGLYQDGTLVAAPAGIGPVEGSPLGIIAVECLVAEGLGIASKSGRSP